MLVGLERTRLLEKVHNRTDWSEVLDLKSEQRPVSRSNPGNLQAHAHRMHFKKHGTLPSGTDTLRETMERHAEAPLVRGGNGPEARDKKLITLPDRKKPTRQQSYGTPGR